jgi:hypothetical protein
MSRRGTARLAGLSAVAAVGLLALPGAASANVTASVTAGKLTATSNAGDAITIACDGTNVKVNTLDPAPATACSAITEIEVMGGPQANTINLNGVTAAQFTALTSVQVAGGGGDDTIAGSDRADTLIGNSGHDRIVGFRNAANTRDVMLGGEGDDTLVWNPGDGDDTMDGEGGSDTVEVNGGNVDEDFEVKPSALAGRVRFDRTGPTPPGPFNLDIGSSEKLQLNANAGNDRIKGAKGLKGLILSTLDGGDGNDRITGTNAEDVLTGGKGFDLIRSADRSADQVDCGGGIDLAVVDRRDTVRACELVIGGLLRVKVSGKSATVADGKAPVTLQCALSRKCKGDAKLLYGGKSLGNARFRLRGHRPKTIHIKLNRRGRLLAAGASNKGARVKLRIVARDSKGNGWRTTDAFRLKG